MAKSNKYKIERAKKYIRLNKNKIIYLTIFVVYTLAMATFVFINRDVFTDCNQGSISSHMPGEGNAKVNQPSTNGNDTEKNDTEKNDDEKNDDEKNHGVKNDTEKNGKDKADDGKSE